MLINYDYDLIIIGAGCAGLSLAHRLTGEDYKVCILELSDNINSKNKLWSFWDTYETPYKDIIKKKWVNLIIKDKNKTSEINCDRYSYNSIDSHDFNNYIFKVIKKNKNIDLILSSEVLNIRKEEKALVLQQIKINTFVNTCLTVDRRILRLICGSNFLALILKPNKKYLMTKKPLSWNFLN